MMYIDLHAKYIPILICLFIHLHGNVVEKNTTENLTYWNNDTLVKDLTHQMEVMRLNLELNTLKFEKELASQKTAFLEEITKLEATQLAIKEMLVAAQEDIRKLLGEIHSEKSEKLPMNSTSSLPNNCAEALQAEGNENGIYKIHIANSGLESFRVYCLRDPDDGPAWTIVQRRQDGSVDFYRDWDEYERGFGNVDGEFFIGMQKLYALTHANLQELWIKMDDFAGQTRYAKYETFAIGDESSKYALDVLGTYHGNAGDNLHAHQGQKFTTKDQDNDLLENGNCAELYTGAWWYTKCHESHLNGQYLRGEYDKTLYAKGINWHAFHGHYYSLKYVHMAVRAVQK